MKVFARRSERSLTGVFQKHAAQNGVSLSHTMAAPPNPLDAQFGVARRGPQYGYQKRKILRTAATLDRYGLTAARASPDQLANRQNDAYFGQGAYRRRSGRMRMRGKGGFWGDLWSGTKQLRSDIGNSLRGGSAGMWGTAAGHAMQALGVGEYVTNSLVNGGGGQAGAGVPSFAPGREGSILVQHEEYLSDVFGPAANTFSNVAYPINPGLEGTFPWLAQIAQNYDEYTIHQLMYTYRSSIAPIGASGTGQVGTVIMATQYNADEPPFTEKSTMLQYAGARSARVIDGMIQGVECNPNLSSGAPGKYTRAGPTLPNQDIKTYDLGVFNMAVTDVPATYTGQSIGELYVSYTVELRKPKLFASLGFGISRDAFVLPLTSGTSVYALANPFLDPAILRGQQNSVDVKLIAAPIQPNATQQFGLGITWPPALTGPFEVSFDLYADAQPVLSANSVVLQNYLAHSGSVRSINDLYEVSQRSVTTGGVTVQGNWQPIQSWGGDVGALKNYPAAGVLTPDVLDALAFAPNMRFHVTFHVHVGVSQGGIPNQTACVITVQPPLAAGPGYPSGGPSFAELLKNGGWRAGKVEIHEYNSAFNVSQNGTNDQIVLVGSSGNVVVPPV